MTPEQRTFFQERGYLLLKGAVSQSQLRPVRERVISELHRLGISPSGQGIPKSIRKLPAFQQITKLAQSLDVPELAAKVTPPKVQEVIDALAEAKPKSNQSQLLVSPPNQGEWRLDELNWHADLSASHRERTPGIQAFVLIDDVEKHGGATLILSGSHRRTGNREEEQRLRDALRRNRENESELQGRNLFIIELSGKAGDVYLMDMRVLHTPSINASRRLRLVATVRFFLS